MPLSLTLYTGTHHTHTHTRLHTRNHRPHACTYIKQPNGRRSPLYILYSFYPSTSIYTYIYYLYIHVRRRVYVHIMHTRASVAHNEIRALTIPTFLFFFPPLVLLLLLLLCYYYDTNSAADSVGGGGGGRPRSAGLADAALHADARAVVALRSLPLQDQRRGQYDAGARGQRYGYQGHVHGSHAWTTVQRDSVDGQRRRREQAAVEAG